jgi:predicted transposase/invertase (TIGR01784 family)
MLIEVQNENENDYFHRMNYGQAKLTTEYLYAGDTYDKIKKVYSVNIVYFDLGHGDDYVYVGKNEFHGIHTQSLLQLNSKQRKVYPVEHVSDIFCTYYILKVNAFNDLAKDSLDEWIYFLKNSEIKDEFRAKGLPEAKERLRRDNLSQTDKVAYDQFIKAKRIDQNVFETAVLEGIMEVEKRYLPMIEEERRQKEEAHQKILELAKFLKQMGVPADQIYKKTGLSEGEISGLE